MKHAWILVALVVASAAAVRPIAAQTLQNGTYIVPKTDAGTQAAPLIMSNEDYFSVFVDGVCINRNESFWQKNIIGVTATLEIDGKSIPMQVFSERAPNTGCRIGVTNFGLLNSIPSHGTQVKLGASILRFDNQDKIKQALQGLGESSSSALMKTYASTALPYISLLGTIGNELYKHLGPDPNGEVLLKFDGMTLEPDAPATNPYRLRDMVLLHYFGTDALDPAKLEERSGDVYYDGKPLRSGAWITFRIEKKTRRVDYNGRPWFTKYNSALQELKSAEPNIETVDKTFADGTVLLYADPDFTTSDQDAIHQSFKDSIEKLEAALKLGQAQKVKAALDNSVVIVKQITEPRVSSPGKTDQVETITPVTTEGVVEAAGSFGSSSTGGTKVAFEPDILKTNVDKIFLAP